MTTSNEIVKNTTECLKLTGILNRNGSDGAISQGNGIGITSNIYNWEIIIIMIVLGIFTAFVAKAFNWIRARFYKDKVIVKL